MAHIFVIIDKSSRKIHLSKERWSHIQKHPEMSDQIEQIKETLKSPLKIIDYALEKEVKYYCQYYKNRKSKAKYLRVVVKYLNGKGFVITAHFVDKIQ